MTGHLPSNFPELREWSADPHPLLDCLGHGAHFPVGGLGPMSMKVSCSQTLEFFIGRYGRELLVPAELPQIARVARLAAASCFTF